MPIILPSNTLVNMCTVCNSGLGITQKTPSGGHALQTHLNSF